ADAGASGGELFESNYDPGAAGSGVLELRRRVPGVGEHLVGDEAEDGAAFGAAAAGRGFRAEVDLKFAAGLELDRGIHFEEALPAFGGGEEFPGLFAREFDHGIKLDWGERVFGVTERGGGNRRIE